MGLVALPTESALEGIESVETACSCGKQARGFRLQSSPYGREIRTAPKTDGIPRLAFLLQSVDQLEREGGFHNC